MSRIASPMGHVLSAALFYWSGEVSGWVEMLVNRKGTASWNKRKPRRTQRKIYNDRASAIALRALPPEERSARIAVWRETPASSMIKRIETRPAAFRV